MEKNNFEDHISDYLDGKLSIAEQLDFENEITTNSKLKREVEHYQKLFTAFSEEKEEVPSERLSTNFKEMLQEEKQNQVQTVSLTTRNKGWMPFLRIAASIILLVGIFFMGRYSGKQELQDNLVVAEQEALAYKEATLISLLGNESASKRIQGVQLVNEFEKPDKDIVAALGEKMLGDENTNVRLSAMEALSNFSYSEQVKAIFIQALETEENPSIQVALIEILGQLQEKKAVEPMKKLLEREDVQPFIKKEINNALPKII